MQLNNESQNNLFVAEYSMVSREDMQMFIERARNFMPIAEYDDHRAADAHPNGGFPLNDQEVLQMFRNALKSVIS